MTRKAFAESECMPHASKKNTHRWCKGKVGVKHQLEAVFDRRWEYSSHHWWIRRCTACGKHLDYYWESPWSSKIKPGWVPR